MTKTYKHKTLGWIAEQINTVNGFYLIKIENNPTHILSELVENSSDREEVVERDWIDNLYVEIWKDDDEDVFREVVLKHTPKQKKFDEHDIYEYVYGEHERRVVKLFLVKHNLLSSDE